MRWSKSFWLRLLRFDQENLSGKNGAPRCQPVHSQQGRDVHLVFTGNDIRRISFENPIGSCFDFASGGGKAGNYKDLADTQCGTGHSVCGLYGLGGGPETVGDFPEGIPLSNRVTSRRGGVRFRISFF